MPKKKSKKSTRSVSRKAAWHTSRIDGHPMLTVVFILFCILVVAVAFLALEVHRASDDNDDQQMMAQPTVSVTQAVSPSTTSY